MGAWKCFSRCCLWVSGALLVVVGYCAVGIAQHLHSHVSAGGSWSDIEAWKQAGRDMRWDENTWKFVAGFCAFWATVRSLILIVQHKCSTDAHNEAYSGCVVRILLMVPIYSIDAFCALHFGHTKYAWPMLIESFREIYEAVVLVSFVQLIAAFLGGPRVMAFKLSKEPVSQLPPVRLVQRFRPSFLRWAPGSEYVCNVMNGIMQYAFIMIFVLVLQAFVWLFIVLDNNEGHEKLHEMVKGFPAAIKAISNGWAMYCLVLWYHELLHCSETRKDMENIRPFNKFGCIKGIVLLTMWQKFIVTGMMKVGLLAEASRHSRVIVNGNQEHWSEAEIMDGLQNILLCVEMVLFAEWHSYAYNPGAWKDVAIEDFFRRVVTGEANFMRIFEMRQEIEKLREVSQEQRKAIKKLSKTSGNASDEELKSAFECFDMDSENKVSIAQLHFMLVVAEGWSDDNAKAKLEEFDADKDGFLCFEEFRLCSLSVPRNAPQRGWTTTRTTPLLSDP